MDLHGPSCGPALATPPIASPDLVRALPLFFLASLFQTCNSDEAPKRAKAEVSRWGYGLYGSCPPLGRVLALAISCANPPPVTEPVWSVDLADLGVILACLAVVERGLDRLLEVVQLVLPGPVSSLRGWS